MLKYRSSAFKNKITQVQIEEVLASCWGMSKWFQIHEDEQGNSQDMVVGFDSEGTAIEIGITYVNDDEVVFHANVITSAWAIRYNEDS